MKLTVEDIDVAYGHSTVLFSVSLEVREGELMCLMGRNGVGKTTLLNAIMGVLPLRSGRVLVDDEDLRRTSTWRRSMMGMGYVPQGHQVFPHLTTRENLQVVIERARPRDTAAVDEALDLFPRLVPLLGRPAGLLSGGQAQQLAIARALVTRPRLLILDEPTEGIQPSIILEIEDAIAELHRSSGLSILLIEQYVEFALRLAQRYSIMDGGRIEQSGDAADADPATFAELLVV